jgi:hypothetical protein
VIGAAVGIAGNGNGTYETEYQIAQAILNLTSGDIKPATPVTGWSSITYETGKSTPMNAGNVGVAYEGTFTKVPGGTTYAPGSSIGNDVRYVLGKYDGPEGGYVLFDLLAFGSHTLPNDSKSIFVNNGNPPEGYTLSNFSVFDGTMRVPPGVIVPEPTTYLTAALLLLPFGVTTLRTIRKNRVS